MSDCVLALDAGGTHTTAWVVAKDGTVLGSGHGGCGNHVLGTLAVVRASFTSAIADALQRAGRRPSSLAAVAAGCAGIEATGETRGPIERLLADLLPGVPSVQAVGDMVIAFHGALPQGAGAVVIAGTGAVAYGEDGRGGACQADGWGHLLGDDGSAYAIGQAALRAAARALDGRGEPTALVMRLPEALGAESLPAVAYAIYGMPDARAQIAALSPIVVATAREGDRVARDLLADQAAWLATAGATVLRKLELGGDDARVATAGSVFHAGPLVVEPFHRALAARAPGARRVEAALPPVGGAAVIAWRSLGIRWDGRAIGRAQATQPV